ncbi:MFTC protein, partial [Spizella passerina]|nr:MFTC protein [Spizella passerina]
ARPAMGAAGPACAAREPPLSREPALRSVLRHVRLENLAAGMSGGVLSTLALHPLDLVKIRFAVSDGLELRPKYNGILHCMSTVWKHEGLRGLYQGVTPNMVGAGASWGLYFFFWHNNESNFCVFPGAMTLCITNPIWVTKTRLVLQYNAGVDPSKRQYRGMFDALIKIYKTEGIRGLYK